MCVKVGEEMEMALIFSQGYLFSGPIVGKALGASQIHQVVKAEMEVLEQLPGGYLSHSLQ